MPPAGAGHSAAVGQRDAREGEGEESGEGGISGTIVEEQDVARILVLVAVNIPRTAAVCACAHAHECTSCAHMRVHMRVCAWPGRALVARRIAIGFAVHARGAVSQHQGHSRDESKAL